MTTYWGGIAWIANSLNQRIEGLPVESIDLTGIREQMKTYVSVPDAGIAGHRTKPKNPLGGFGDQPGSQHSSMDAGLPFSLPFDVHAADTAGMLGQQNIPLSQILEELLGGQAI